MNGAQEVAAVPASIPSADRQPLLERLAPLLDVHGHYYVCPFCMDDFFDLTGFAHHLYLGCSVVQTLSDENDRLVQESNERHAQAIEARRAETLGSVHESAVGNADAPLSQPEGNHP